MSLQTYNAKRNFSRTAEPKGKVAKSEGRSFVIQKHAARRLHYDFRLEMDGVLKSWAVTRGPSLVPGERRLAVHVEDHPLDYGGFEGNIPKGEYGGGSVLLWDRGVWTPIGDPKKGYRKGHLEFELSGEKLEGRWHLVRMEKKEGEARENWLLIKSDDEFARTEDEPDILEERPESVLSGRAIEDLKGEPPGWSSKTGPIEGAGRKATMVKDKRAKKGRAKGVRQPEFIEPQLATLVAKPPSGKRWIHEVKFDGYRLQVHVEGQSVKMLTRSGLDWTERFGSDIPKLFAGMPVKNAIIDGELVVENQSGSSDFSALQAALSAGKAEAFLFYAFDLLFIDGEDIRSLPLIERKRKLQEIIGTGSDRLRFSEHFPEEGNVVLQHACRLSLEGIVSKLRDVPYASGRGRDWVKSKCTSRQEFVVAGYVPSSTGRNAIGSLVMGLYEGEDLVHVGRVGTGYSTTVAADLFERLRGMKRAKSPFSEKLTADERRDVVFVEPELVAEVEFRAWTADGNLRHASFRGLREDKKAEDVVRETPKEPTTKAPKAKAEAPRVRLTHPDRIYWPDAGVTKQGLADYYTEMWPWMGPFIVGRPLALLRAPEGVGGETFFQKHAWRGMNKRIELFDDPKTEEEDKLIMVSDLDGLIGLVQSGVLEIHPWGASIRDIEHPDMIIMDLDPGEGVAWSTVIEAAFEVRERLEAAGLNAFVKTSGGKGLHVVAPLKPKTGWDETKQFTKEIAEAMAKDAPDKYVATITKSKRSGKILIDYLRNGRGNTAVAPYSTRARAGAPVSMPLAWDELGEAIGPNHFTVLNSPQRMASLKTDPWGDFRKAAKPLEVKPGRRKKK